MPRVMTASECLPSEEMRARQKQCRTLCARLAPDAGGLLVFSRLNIYYLTGTLAGGLLWLPQSGEPVLLVRKAQERCRLESPQTRVVPFHSYADIAGMCADLGAPLTEVMAAEMTALPWALAGSLQKHLAGRRFVSGDAVLHKARSVKSPWERNKMRLAGQRHHKALTELLPALMRSGMSEYALARLAWQVFFSLGHGGVNRMGNYGEDCFLGHIAAGDNGNYPSHFNGPLGLKGCHPAVPVMGHAASLWNKGQVLALDIGFMLEGYHTDKTQVYWAGARQSLPDAVFRAHEAGMEIQQRAAAMLKPGAVPARIWEEAVHKARELGVEEGFMGLGGNKVGFLGHGIGLVIDETPVIAPRFEAPLEEGMVMAIEPKIGLPGVGMVGVENTFEVTPDGGKSITGDNFAIICVE